MEKDVKIAGGVSTVRQYVEAGLVDTLHFAVAPVVMGCGEAMFAGMDLSGLGYSVAQRVSTEKATHYVLRQE